MQWRNEGEGREESSDREEEDLSLSSLLYILTNLPIYDNIIDSETIPG